MVHTVTIKPDVYKELRAVRYELSDQTEIVTFNEAIAKLIAFYRNAKLVKEAA